MSSEILTRVREYEKRHEALISEEERPVFHLSPRVGWMNDPNGFSIYKGEYHIFYQYHPYETKWGPMYWGHAVSRDLVSWTYLPAAIAPDEESDNAGCFSGSALELPDGRQLLMYTGVKGTKLEDGTSLTHQTQCIAFGDGQEYVKYENNPVIDSGSLPKGFSAVDFRDPKLWQEPDGSYSCVIANRTDDKSGAILLYHSPDGIEWSFVSVLDRSRNECGAMWECPDFFELEGKSVLLISPQEMEADGLEYHCGNGTVCILGQYDAGTHTLQRESVHSVDYGIDFYATQTLLTPDGRRIMTAWMQNWDTVTNRIPDCKWFGQAIVPRELHVRGGRLIQNPVRELEKLRRKKVVHRNVSVGKEVSLDGISGRIIDMTVSIRPESGEGYRLFGIETACGGQHKTVLEYCPGTSTIHLDRRFSGCRSDVVHERKCFVRDRQGELKLRIVMDKYSMEVFVNDGEQAITACIYTDQSADGIRFFSEGGSVGMDVEKYELGR